MATSRQAGANKDDFQDSLLNIYSEAFNSDGSPSSLRDLQDLCISEVESVIPDAEDLIDDDSSDDE